MFSESTRFTNTQKHVFHHPEKMDFVKQKYLFTNKVALSMKEHMKSEFVAWGRTNELCVREWPPPIAQSPLQDSLTYHNTAAMVLFNNYIQFIIQILKHLLTKNFNAI